MRMSLMTRVSNLEKTQNDILTPLHLMNDWLNGILESLIETTRKCVPFAPDKTVEPCAPQAAAHVESDAKLRRWQTFSRT